MRSRTLSACCFRALRSWMKAQAQAHIPDLQYSHRDTQVWPCAEVLASCCMHVRYNWATDDTHWRTASHHLTAARCPHAWSGDSFAATAAVMMLTEGGER
jgi:hypothetical protein